MRTRVFFINFLISSSRPELRKLFRSVNVLPSQITSIFDSDNFLLLLLQVLSIIMNFVLYFVAIASHSSIYFCAVSLIPLPGMYASFLSLISAGNILFRIKSSFFPLRVENSVILFMPLIYQKEAVEASGCNSLTLVIDWGHYVKLVLLT